MDEKTDNNAVGEVLHEVQELRRELSVMQRRMGLLGPERSSKSKHQLNVYFDKVESERKPYAVSIGGLINITLSLSSVRAAVFLIYLLDLEDRLDGGLGISDKVAAITKACSELTPELRDNEDVKNSIRVAIYRFQFFVEDKFKNVAGEYSFGFDDKTKQLELRSADDSVDDSSVDFQISADDASLSSIIDNNLTRSPLARVRKRGAMHVPAGYGGVDDLLLGFYDHPYRLQVTSLYVRPTFTTYPDSLLNIIGVSDRTKQRKRLALEGYKSGRFRFVEILNTQTIDELATRDDSGRFKFYPELVEEEHVLEHLSNLIETLQTYESFELYLTSATSPFVVVTYRIETAPVPEFYTVFFQHTYLGQERDLESFVIQGVEVYQSMQEHVVGWLLSHPTTIVDKTKVLDKLERVKDSILARG
ncbi:MAG: hypothetical protein KDD66_03880 [Bdellovibrionales bacterium]|nr:hypothetical protein [Bdellovibrionales bacterium]